MSWLSVVAGGAAGGVITYALSWYREYRRSAEGYRFPQRQAVGDIVAAKSELIAMGALSVVAVDVETKRGTWAGQPGGAIDAARIAGPMNDARSAADDLLRALELARIVVADPRCRRARDEVNSALEAVSEVLARGNPRNFVEAALYGDDMRPTLVALDHAVTDLVDVSEDRLGLVVTLGTLLRRRWDRIRGANADPNAA